MIETSRKGTENKFKNLKGIDEAYRYYKKKNSNPVDKKTFRKVLRTYLKNAAEYIKRGGDFKMHGSLGSLSIIKMDNNGFQNKKPDWKATKELWEQDEQARKDKFLVYHLNEHSDYKYYRFYWNKGVVKNLKYVSFVPARGIKRSTSKAIKTERQDYLKK